MEKALGEVYADPRQPGSFGGVEKVVRGLKRVKNLKASSKEVKKWLAKKDTYTKFTYSRKNFKRNPIIALHIDQQWQGDLADMANIRRDNDNVTFLLVLIDVVSKYLWVEPLKSKSGRDVLEGFKKIFSRTKRTPLKLQTDDGKEFWDKGVQNYLKTRKINFFTLRSDKKAAIAERVIRTLKAKIWRYMHEKHTKRYVDVLQDLVSSYNETYHKSIKMTPSEVNQSNEGEVLGNLYGAAWKEDKKRKKPKYKEGDFVRLSAVKGVFEKGYMGNWTEEIFVIDKVKTGAIPQIMYKLSDFNKEPIEGSFYSQELQLVSKDLTNDFWKVESILSTKMVRGRKQYFVKWEGYPESMNSWVDDKAMKRL